MLTREFTARPAPQRTEFDMPLYEIREWIGHLFWFFILLLDIFLLTLFILAFVKSFRGLAYFLSGIIVVPLIGSLLFSLIVVHANSFLLRRDLLDRHGRPILRAERERLSSEKPNWWAALGFWKKRWAFLRNCTRIEFFGWIVFVCGSLAAINAAIEKNPNEEYFKIVDLAAYDLTRAAVVGVIVLFFAQILRQHKETVGQIHNSALEASDAATTAREALTRAAAVVPKIDKAVANGLNVLKKGFDEFARFRLIDQMFKTIEKLPYHQQELYAEIGDLINDNIMSTLHELDSPTGDDFELISFYGLYIGYLKSESLSFARKNSAGEAVEAGRGTCELATRFINYSIAVRRIVDMLETVEPKRYEYYTIFVGEPHRFFNIENRGADPDWSIDFLDFCKQHRTQKLFYQRHFVSNSLHDGDGERLYNTDAIVQSLTSNYIACHRDDGLPVLWRASSMESNLYDSLAPLAAACSVEDPGFIIFSYPDTGRGVTVSLPALPNSCDWQPIGAILPNYLSPTCPPGLLEFRGVNLYRELFGDVLERHPSREAPLLPRDLFAVRDTQSEGVNDGWKLCMGALSPLDYGAVRLFFATARRSEMRRGSWEKTTQTLSRLFLGSEGSSFYKKVPLADLGLVWTEDNDSA